MIDMDGIIVRRDHYDQMKARIDALEAALQGWHMAGDILNDRIGRLEAALRFALEVMESYSKLDGRDPSHATPSSAIGVARAALAPEQDK